MDSIKFAVALFASMGAWAFVTNTLLGRMSGNFIKILAGMATGIVTFFLGLAILFGGLLDRPTSPEQTAEAVRLAGVEKAKSAAKDRSSMASIICKDHVRELLKAPASADFPLLDFKVRRQGNQRYVITSYVDAHNSYGAPHRSNWQCDIQYNRGEEVDTASWTLHKLDIS